MSRCRISTLMLMVMFIAVASVAINDIPVAGATNVTNLSANLVLDYNSTVTLPSNVGSYLDVDISIDGPDAINYTYVFLLIHENAYEANIGAINVTSDGTSAGTSFTINGTRIDTDLVNANQTQLVNLLNDIFGPDNNDMFLKQSISSNSTTGSFEGLEYKNQGHYIVFTAVLSSDDLRLVAFNQTTVIIGTQTLEYISISASSNTVNAADTTLITVNATNNFGETYAVDPVNITWNVHNNTGAGTLNNQTGVFTGVEQGLVNVTASYTEDGVTKADDITITVTPAADPITGDVNGDGIISSVDALMVLQMTVGNIAEDPAADVNGDGNVTSLDALMILQASVGAIEL